MSITKISNTRNAGGLLRYILDDKAHDGSDERYISASAYNCTIGNARNEFKAIQRRYNKEDNVQAYSIIISWDTDELNPYDEEDIQLAQQSADLLGRDIAGENRQVVVSIQRDGRGGKLHGHIAINSVDMLTGKSLRGTKLTHYYIKTKSDEIQRQLNILNKNEVTNEYTDRQTIQEIKARDKGAYIWKDDIKSRIESCMENPNIVSYEDFKQEMKDRYNVDVTERKTKKEDVYGGYILTYTFNDKNNKKRKVRSTRLGTMYGLKGVEYGIETNKQQRQTVATETEYELKRRLTQQLETERQRRLDKERDRERTRKLNADNRELELEYRKLKQKQYERSL